MNWRKLGGFLWLCLLSPCRESQGNHCTDEQSTLEPTIDMVLHLTSSKEG